MSIYQGDASSAVRPYLTSASLTLAGALCTYAFLMMCTHFLFDWLQYKFNQNKPAPQQ